MKKVLIVNAVPVNIGDAALVISLYEAMERQGFDVAIASHRHKIARNDNSDVRLVRDLLDYPIIKMSSFLKYLLIPFCILFHKQYRQADLIVGAPGGYINSYYRLFDKLYVLFICKMFGKKTAIYSQSIGPLNSKDAKYFSFFVKFLDLLYVRDRLSYETTVSLAGAQKNIVLTQDAAFLLPPKQKERKNTHTIAVSVRDWSHDCRDRSLYYALIASLVNYCLREGYSVDFLSTCQGVPGYVDDSKVAEMITAKHLRHHKMITIDRKRRSLEEFRDKLTEYDFVIGTRLHMCILSMLSGTPAFNISYEVKGRECYTYLGMPEFSIDYNADSTEAVKALDRFVGKLDSIERYQQKQIALSHADAHDHFHYFCLVLGSS